MSKARKAIAGKADARKVISTKNVFTTLIRAQCASAAPPLGPLLGSFGLNINNFCKAFNEKTKVYKQGVPLPVTVRIKPDRTYDINLETPSLRFYVMQAAGITKVRLPDEKKSGEITLKHIYEIAKIKQTDPFSRYQILDLDQIVKETIGVATIVGLELVKEIDPIKYKEFLDKRTEYLEEVARQQEEEEKLKLQRL